MKMKKMVTLGLAFAMAASMFAGCGGSGSKSASTDAAKSSSASSAKTKTLKILPTAYETEEYAIALNKDDTELVTKVNGALADLQSDGTLDKIVAAHKDDDGEKEAGSTGVDYAAENAKVDGETLTMATSPDFPPYEYMSGDKYAGIDVDIAYAIATKLGMKLDIQNVSFDSIIAGVQTGKYDLGFSGITITEDRKKSVAFSDPYITSVQSIIVRGDSKITSKDDITSDTKIGVQTGTTGDTDASDEYGDKNIVRFKVATDAVQALVSGKVDCVIIDEAPAKEYVKANNK